MYDLTKKYLKIALILIIPYILIISACVIKSNQEIVFPGGTTLVENRVEVNGGNESGELYSLYVYSFQNSTIFQNLYLQLTDFNDLYDSDPISNRFDHMTTDLWNKSGVIQRNQSEESSVINAYKLANKVDSTITVTYDYQGVIVYLTTVENKLFQIGDIITHVNGEKLLNQEQYLNYFRNDLIVSGQTKFSVLRNNEAIELTADDSLIYKNASGDKFFTSFVYDKLTEIKTTPSYTLKPTSSQGPSAGMMQTLSIYNQLVPFDITKGKKIIGTGTIETNGEVGAIGGVKQKMYSAVKQNADYIIVPIENYDDALKQVKKMNFDESKLITYKTIEEVIAWMQTI